MYVLIMDFFKKTKGDFNIVIINNYPYKAYGVILMSRVEK